MTEPRQCEGPQDPFCSLKQYVPVPVEGEWFVDNGKVRKITESECCLLYTSDAADE